LLDNMALVHVALGQSPEAIERHRQAAGYYLRRPDVKKATESLSRALALAREHHLSDVEQSIRAELSKLGHDPAGH
jgi:hypothetical protein